MRVHKLNNVEQAMDLLEKHKVYLFSVPCTFRVTMNVMTFLFFGSGGVMCILLEKGGGRLVVVLCISNVVGQCMRIQPW